MYVTADGFNSRDVAYSLSLVCQLSLCCVAMEDSVILIESSKTGWKKTYETLKGTRPQCISWQSQFQILSISNSLVAFFIIC